MRASYDHRPTELSATIQQLDLVTQAIEKACEEEPTASPWDRIKRFVKGLFSATNSSPAAAEFAQIITKVHLALPSISALLQAGTTEQRQSADRALRSIHSYNQALERYQRAIKPLPDTPRESAANLRKIEFSASACLAPRKYEKQPQGDVLSKVQGTFASQLGSPSGLPQTIRDLFKMKAIALLKTYGLSSLDATAAIHPGTALHLMGDDATFSAQQTIHLPTGDKVSISALFERNGDAAAPLLLYAQLFPLSGKTE